MAHISTSALLCTSNYQLRIVSEEDIPFVFSASRHKGFNDGMLWDAPETEEELIQPLKEALAAWNDGTGYSFTIEDRKTGTFLGRISIRQTDTKDIWNMGFWTHPDHQGKGIMKEVVSVILAFAFDQLGAREVQACHALWNKASERILQTHGFTLLRYIEKGYQKHGEWIPENLLRITSEDWAS